MLNVDIPAPKSRRKAISEAVDITLGGPCAGYTDRHGNRPEREFRYFCGVCWRRVSALEAAE